MAPRTIALSILLMAQPALWMGRPAFAGELSLVPTAPLTSGEPAILVLRAAAFTPEAKIKIKASEGEITEVDQSQRGVATVRFLAPNVSEDTLVTVRVKVSGDTRLEEELTVPVTTADAGTLGLRFDPPQWVDGDGPVAVVVTVPAGPRPVAERSIWLHASEGKLSAVSSDGYGVFTAKWTAPGAMDGSRVVLFTAADAAAPGTVVGWGGLPVATTKSVSLDAPPGSNNALVVGQTTLGPFPASPTGTVAFDVAVDPRNPVATLKTVGPGSARSEKRVELVLGSGPPLALMPLPPAVPADPTLGVVVQLAVVQASGVAREGATPKLTASKGTMGPTSPTAVPGVYSALWNPPADPETVRILAELDGHRAEGWIKMVPAMPSASVVVDPAELPVDARDFTVRATLKDGAGTAQPGLKPALTVTGGSPVGSVQDQKDGSYLLKARADRGQAPLYVHVEPRLDPTGAPPSTVVLWPVVDRLPADGTSEVPLSVVVLDASGVPIPKVTVQLSATGSALVPPTVTTGPSGLGRVDLRAGATAERIVVTATAAGLRAVTEVHLGAGTAGEVPVTGSAATVKAAERARATFADARVTRERPPEPVVVAPTVASNPTSTTSSGTTAAVTASYADTGGDVAAVAPSDGTPPAKPTAEGWLRLGAHVGLVTRAYAADADDEAVVSPPTSEFARGDLLKGNPAGSPAIGVSMLAWVADGPIGLDAYGTLWQDRLEVVDEEFDLSDWNARAGLRYRRGENLKWYGLAQFERTTVPVFMLIEPPSIDVEIVQHQLLGARLGGGLTYTAGRFHGDIQLAETFTPFPVDTGLVMGMDYAVKDKLAAHLAFDLSFRGMELEVYGDEVRVEEQVHGLLVGVTALLP